MDLEEIGTLAIGGVVAILAVGLLFNFASDLPLVKQAREGYTD